MIARLHEEEPSGTRVGVRDRDVNQQLLLQNEYRLVNDKTKPSVKPSR